MTFAPEEVTWEVAPLEEKFDETETFEEPEERLEEPNASEELPPTSPIQKSMQPIEQSEAPQPAPPEEEFEGGRGKRVRKESAYVRRIRDGENASALPKGIQVAPEMAGGAWEVEEEDWAMASMMNQAELLEPTYEEVKRRPDCQNGSRPWKRNSEAWRQARPGQLLIGQPMRMSCRPNGFSASKRMLLAKSRNTRPDSWRVVLPKCTAWTMTRLTHR